MIDVVEEEVILSGWETLTVRMKEVRPMSVVSSSDLLDTRAKLKGDTWHLKLLASRPILEEWISCRTRNMMSILDLTLAILGIGLWEDKR